MNEQIQEQEVKTLPLRSQVAEQDKWAVERVYASPADWEKDFEAAKDLLPRLASYQGRLGEGWQVMLEYLQLDEKFSLLLERLYLYASMRRDEDNGNSEFQALRGRAESLAVEAGQVGAFFSPEVLALPEAQLASYLDRPELQLYRLLFRNITRYRPHTLSPAEEQLLAASGEMGAAFHNIYSLLANADLQLPVVTNEQGQPEQLSNGNYVRLLKAKDRSVREQAFHAMYAAYAGHGNTIGALLAASVKKDNFYAAAGRYRSALDASLFGDNVDESVYRNLIATVRRHLPGFHRYLRQRKALLGLDELHMWDVYVPLFPELSLDFDWPMAKNVVLQALEPLGPDYVRTLAQGLEDRWCDVYENKGKTSGAYSTGCYGCDPYILLNFQNDLNSVFTLAHEAGHSMHTYYSQHNQPYIYADYRIFVAEVASTVNENLLIDFLLRCADRKDEVRYLVNHYLEEFRATVIRQTMFAEFELLIHEAAQQGEALTADYFCRTYLRLNQEYFGPDMVVDDEIKWEWARIPHFYRGYYVYKYATGFSAASALALGLISEDQAHREQARRRYLEFLAGGSSKDPLELLQDAGVDMRTPQPVEEAFKLFEGLIDTIG
ncbi:MAG: oligoendopeptidase F [Firmicutes bacterium]|nr:oligoendopeptidase F [Bacillota bacterium]